MKYRRTLFLITACSLALTHVLPLAARGLDDTSVSKNMPSEGPSIRLADDYCNTRCNHQFEYCRYRGGSHDHCQRVLVTCRANC